MAEGDRDALGVLFDRHGSAALALAEGMLGSRPEAEEILHDVFVDAWKVVASPDAAIGSIRAWLLIHVWRRARIRMTCVAYARPGRADLTIDLRATGE